MKFNLGPLGQPGDPLGDDKGITVDMEDSPRARPGEFKLAKLSDCLPPDTSVSSTIAPDPLGFDSLPLSPAAESLKITLAPPARSESDFAGLEERPIAPSSRFAKFDLAPAVKADFAGLGDAPEEALRVPGDGAGEGSFRKGSDSGAQDPEDFEDRGQIIETESLYRSSTGWEVTKRIVMSKSGRERTVVSCPGHLVVI
jgi:hypothetical protein